MRKTREAGRSGHRKERAMASADRMIEAAAGLAEAERLRLEGKLDKAKKICAGLLVRDPDYSGAHHTMGLVCADMHNYPLALSHLVRALMHNPDNWMTLTALSGVYLRLGAGVMAARKLEQARALKPDDAGILVTLGEIFRDNREYERAVQTFRHTIAMDDTLEAAKYGLGLCLLELGELGEAANAFEQLLAAGNTSITTLNALSELPPDLVASDVLALCEAATPAGDQSPDFFEMAKRFTRAAALHNAGRHSEAWPEIVAANAAVAPSFEKDRAEQAAIQQKILDGMRETNVKVTEARTTDDTPMSLFILGVSRSGKTTAERLVGAIEGVKCGYESPIVENTVKQTFYTAGLPGRQEVIELPPGLGRQWRDAYLAELTARVADMRVFTNTNPGQIVNALRIASTIPNARFLLIKRDVQDASFRIFMKKYQSGNPYAYDLEHIRWQIDWYDQMIDVLAKKAPAVTRVINYEEMIAAPAIVLDAACELCGLAGPSGDLPVPGDDRSCSAPYTEFMRAAKSD